MWYKALAIPIRWRWPPDNLIPRSPTNVLYCWGDSLIIKSCKFFIGNLCFAYSIAEGLKTPRLLETCPDFPVVFPHGDNAYDFYHQIHFEKLFKSLNTN